MRQLRGPLQIVRSAGRNVVKLQLLRHAAAEEHDDAVAHLVSRGMERVLIRQADRQAEGIAARHNGDLVDRLLRGQEVCRNGVARLVDGRDAPVALDIDKAPFFRPGNDLEDGVLHGLHRNDGQVLPRRNQRGLVE